MTDTWHEFGSGNGVAVPKFQRVYREFLAVFVPFQAVLDAAAKEAPPAYWVGDGVQPSIAGHQRMAEAWLKAVGE